MTEEKKRGRGNPAWVPGKSANPGGRKKHTQQEKDAIALAKQFSPDAVRTLHEICIDKTAEPRARAICANSLLDRAWGKPKETVEARVTHDHRSESEIIADLAALGLAVPSSAAGEGTANGKGKPTTH